MPSLSIIVFFALIACAASVPLNAMEQDENQKFEDFIKMFHRKYANDTEKLRRFKIFKEGLRMIIELNKQRNTTRMFGITQFADWTKDEFKKLLMDPKYLKSPGNSTTYQPPVGTAPVGQGQGIDWRTKGVISSVKNQGQCGSCWSFAVTANIETLHLRNTGQHYDLSEQALVDCDTTSLGCFGGYPSSAFDVAIQRGIPHESEYVYTGVQGQCRYTQANVRIRSQVSIPAGHDSLKSYLFNNGPFIGTALITHGLQYFKGGKIYMPTASECAYNLGGHAWFVVGYGYEGNQPYYIIKNSWGLNWGDQGYVRFAAGGNYCNSEERSYAGVY